MKVQMEISLYPLRMTSLTEPIDRFTERLRRSGFSVEIGPMSSRVSGECADIFCVLGEAFEAAARDGDVVLTVKASNACPVEK